MSKETQNQKLSQVEAGSLLFLSVNGGFLLGFFLCCISHVLQKWDNNVTSMSTSSDRTEIKTTESKLDFTAQPAVYGADPMY